MLIRCSGRWTRGSDHSLRADYDHAPRVVFGNPLVVKPVTFGAVLDALAHGPVYLCTEALGRFEAQLKARPELNAKALCSVAMDESTVCVLWDQEVPAQAAEMA